MQVAAVPMSDPAMSLVHVMGGGGSDGGGGEGKIYSIDDVVGEVDEDVSKG